MFALFSLNIQTITPILKTRVEDTSECLMQFRHQMLFI